VRAPKVEIFSSVPHLQWDHPGLWYWRLRAANGKIIADGSQGYASKSNVQRAVFALMETMRCGGFVFIVEVDK
jgi:uncharacterized protein YegP (UPF0339 family)